MAAEACALTADELEQIEDRRAGEVLQVKQLWGGTLLAVRHLGRRSGRRVTVGEGPRADLYAPVDEGAAAVRSLVRMDGRDAVLVLAPGMRGTLVDATGQRHDLEALRRGPVARASREGAGLREISLPPGSEVQVCCGPMRFALEFVVPGRKIAVPWWTRVDRDLLGAVLLIGLAEVALLGLAFIAPPDLEALDLEAYAAADRFVKVLLQPALPSRASRPALPARGPKPGTGARARGDEGLQGERNRPILRRRPGQPVAERLEQARRERDRRVATSRGLLRLLGGRGGSTGLDRILGSGGLGRDLERDLGAVSGRVAVAGNHLGGGYGGLGDRGLGPGGGGLADMASLGELTGLGDGPGPGLVSLGSHRPVEEAGVSVETGTAVLLDALPRSVIRAVIHRKRAQVRACYERELINHPGLSGKILVRFTIGPRGTVSGAAVQDSTLGSPQVEQCVVRKLEGWAFPRPKGGGSVLVRYPFIFAPAGS